MFTCVEKQAPNLFVPRYAGQNTWPFVETWYNGKVIGRRPGLIARLFPLLPGHAFYKGNGTFTQGESYARAKGG